MLMYGPKVTDNKTALKKIEVRQMVDIIRNPKNEVAKHINVLRSVMLINPDAYNRSKRALPYIVPSIFSPPFRRGENFAYSQHLILDLDKVSDAQMDINQIKEQLKKDSRVEVMFISPSGNGLKIFFRLEEKLFDANQYSIFYKNFAHKFGTAYNLLQIIDMQTNDVTRACFLSHDPQIYYNANAEALHISDYVDFDNILQATHGVKQIDKDFKEQTIITKKKDNLDSDTFVQIKQKLNPNYRPRGPKKRIITVPDQLLEIEKIIREYLSKELEDVEIENVKDINYGKQFLFKYELHYAEFNIFFGKKGITILKTNKKINNPNFQEVMYKLLNQILLSDGTLPEKS